MPPASANKKFIKGYANGDFSAATEVSLYDFTGTAVTLGANDQLWLESAVIRNSVTGDLRLFADTDDDNALDAGEEILRDQNPTSGGIDHHWGVDSPFPCPVGAKPHVLGAAGTGNVNLFGFVLLSEATS